MKESIRRCAERGMPIYAECGGLMYLCKAIQGFNGEYYEMAGIVPAVCKMQKSLQRIGYVKGETLLSSIIADAGDTLKGHEFHFSTLEYGEGFPWAYNLQGSRQKRGIWKAIAIKTYWHHICTFLLMGIPKLEKS